ncbi:MAG: 30S ribosomal protein S17 [Desulfobulbaceae bacterium]|uniref:Small ribosomal subunit protein uS17 n=1 Tax=Candidatus Desulfobia pelagia TaxID=2841692 RepID=A0A8J6TDC8_9BACT|nr:30S ribosomal protein S17 [Candidatus Desulfobia pelagia]
MENEKTIKKTKVGVVISDKMEKSIVVQTERLIRHKVYGKFIRRHIKYMADDPESLCKIGDRVLIEECRPLSRKKRWRLLEVIEKAV